MKGEKDLQCWRADVLWSINLPFAQADTDYCSEDRPACFSAKSIPIEMPRSTDPPDQSLCAHRANLQTRSRSNIHTHTSHLTASCQYQVQTHRFKSDTGHISKQRGLLLALLVRNFPIQLAVCFLT